MFFHRSSSREYRSQHRDVAVRLSTPPKANTLLLNNHIALPHNALHMFAFWLRSSTMKSNVNVETCTTRSESSSPQKKSRFSLRNTKFEQLNPDGTTGRSLTTNFCSSFVTTLYRIIVLDYLSIAAKNFDVGSPFRSI